MKYSSFLEIIEQGAVHFQNHPAILSAHADGSAEVLSYSDLRERVMQRCDALKKESFGCAGLYGPLSEQWIIDLFAAAIAGKRVVLLDPSLPDEVTQSLIDEYEIEQVLPGENRFQPCSAQGGQTEYAGHILVFSSGTTASNKAVILSQKALAYACWNGQQELSCGTDDIIAAILPVNHVFGLVCTMLWPLCYGAAVGIGRGMRYYTEDPKTYHVTILVLVPTLLNYLLATDSLNPECHTVLVGAAPCDAQVLNRIREKNIRVGFGYGLSETASGIAISVDSRDPFALKLCPDTKITIAEDGEVLVSTPCMMEGYWKRPEETAAVLKDGILHTGDLGMLDAEGCLHLSGRKNDVLVLKNGEKIFCPEWEAELSKLLGNEIALALINDTLTLVAGNQADEAAVKRAADRFSKDKPISRKIMQVFILPGALPRTATGKLKRWKLEEVIYDRSGNDG
ncbi:MAG: acyl--CoA ligase [Solobacterium sp.]|nr:acyl--CoA ligase [Solobacterium sp.]